MDSETLFRSEAWLQWLFQFVGPDRKLRFAEKIQQRTRSLTVVLENIYQPHNASAVLRSCECFGIQDVHVIENQHRFKSVHDVSLGSAKWLSIHRYHAGLSSCMERLKQSGYTVIATSPHAQDMPLDALSISPERPLALLMGTEDTGLSEEAMAAADGFVKIPMHGFTESLNISVSAAIALYHLSHQLRKHSHWQLKAEEQREVLIQWASACVRNLPEIKRQFLQFTNQPLQA